MQALQAVCRHVRGRPEVEITTTTTAQARDATTRVLEQVGGPGELDDRREASQAFLVATMQHA